MPGMIMAEGIVQEHEEAGEAFVVDRRLRVW
jgi:hypothetical protein